MSATHAGHRAESSGHQGAAGVDVSETEHLASLFETACRLGGLTACLCLRADGARLVEYGGRDVPCSLPIRDSFAGACFSNGRAGVTHLGEDLLHSHERTMLRNEDCHFWLAVPIVVDEGQGAAGVVVAYKPPPLGPGSGELERGAVGLVAEHIGLRWKARDLSVALQAERARTRLLEGEAEGILHSLRAAAIVLDADDRLHDANRAAETLLDFHLPHARGRLVEEVIGDELIRGVLAESDATSSGGAPLPEVRVGANHEVVLEVRISPVFDSRGELRWRVVVFNDTTVLRQADELKTEFVSMVSHELRTPLTSIKAFAATLLRDESAQPNDQREWLRIIDRECDRLTALINDLLAISRLESGKPLSMHHSRFDLMALLRDVGEAQQAAARKHTVVVQGPPEAILEADRDKVRQVFTNLVNNAIKYSPRGGEVAVTVEMTEAEARILVRDSGVGIRQEHLNVVFEKFFQVDGSSTRRVGGSGLGLYLTRRLVQAHGGKVWAESELGRGTTIVVVLPRHKTELAPDDEAALAPRLGKSER